MGRIGFEFDGETVVLYGADEAIKRLYDQALALHGLTAEPVQREPRYEHGQAYMRLISRPAPVEKRQRGQLSARQG